MTEILGVAAILLVVSGGGWMLLRPRYGSGAALGLVLTSQSLHVAATIYRYGIEVLNDDYTETASDTFRYLLYGRARWLNETPLLSEVKPGNGTETTYALSQAFFTVLGDHRFLVFLLGSSLGLIGLWFIALALRTAREAAPLGFAFAIVAFPTTVYWSASFGKDSVTLLALGAVLQCVARTARSHSVHVESIIGLAVVLPVILCVRMDVGLVLIGGLLLAWIGATNSPSHRFRIPVVIIAYCVLPLALLTAILLEIDDPWGIVEEFTGSYERTSLGGSDLETSRPSGILGILVGVFTAVFRPMPWELGVQGLLSSLDIIPLVAAVAVLVNSRRLSGLSTPSARLVLCTLFFAIAVFAQLTEFGNLGLLVRLRSLIVPTLILAIALVPQPFVFRSRDPLRAPNSSLSWSQVADHSSEGRKSATTL